MLPRVLDQLAREVQEKFGLTITDARYIVKQPYRMLRENLSEVDTRDPDTYTKLSLWGVFNVGISPKKVEQVRKSKDRVLQKNRKLARSKRTETDDKA